MLRGSALSQSSGKRECRRCERSASEIRSSDEARHLQHQYGIGRDGRFDLDRIATEVEGADIIALQEVTQEFCQRMAASTWSTDWPRCCPIISPPSDRRWTSISAPRTAKDGRSTQRFQFGNMVLSRLPIVAVAQPSLAAHPAGFRRGNLQRSALEALVITPSGPLRIYSVHLDHVSVTERTLADTATSRSAPSPMPTRAARSAARPNTAFPSRRVPRDSSSWATSTWTASRPNIC